MSNPDSTQVLGNRTQVLEREPGKPVEIAGYRLEDRLGVGGYGEVWRAVSPGGLPKAVKILFGQMDGPQADAELKSLQRMRDLRHPFLLSIERIEIVDGKLVVVTELADGCLDKRFQEARAEGLKGIPRDELLGYLRDTADALDFMFEEHGLQHLDIKPENLLVQGRHVKVGDFGLAKDVNVTNMSLVGGFTPLYAPPEIFEGTPSPSSDQYSLAIVYQTMLTGVPPFSGRTAAQLTAQHLRSSPDLSPLQPVDRPVIARALSKNPAARFPGCREFVDELTKRRNSRSRSNVRSNGKLTASKTEQVSVQAIGASDDFQIRKSEPLAVDKPKGAASHRPTIFVGVGGLGGDVLTAIRERFEEDYPNCSAPSFPMLYIDSDRQAIAAKRAVGEKPGLAESELLTTPLRSSTEYRADKRLNLEWLSRRWLFNVPRSGEVEGIRPLGRLALVDNRKLVHKRLGETFQHAISDDAIRTTAEEMGLTLEAGLVDVVVVGSAHGGFSSGAMLEVAAMVRTELEELKFGISSLIGVLMHGTSSQRDIGDIQEANTISCLTELRHYRTPGLGNLNLFDHTYVVQLGDSLTSPEFAERTDEVAEYIYTTTLTDTRAYTDHWRDCETSKSSDVNAIRTFGYSAMDETLHRTLSEAAGSLCYALSQKWTSQPTQSPELAETRLLLQNLTLSETRLSAQIMSILRGEQGKKIDAWAKSKWAELVAGAQGQPINCKDAVAKIEEVFATDPDVIRILTQVSAAQPVGPEAAKRQLTDHLVQHLDQPGRLNVAASAASELVTQLDVSTRACQRLLSEIDRSAADLQKLIDLEQATPEEVETRCYQYCVVRFYRCIYQFFVDYVSQMLDTVRERSEQLAALRTELRTLAIGFVPAGIVPASQPELLVEAFDNQILTEQNFALGGFFEKTVDRETATQQLLNAAQGYLLAQAGKTPGDRSKSDSGFPSNARPRLFNAGGGHRVVAVLPPSASEEDWKQKLNEVFGDCASTVVREGQTELVVAVEAEGIQIETILDNYRHKNPRLMEIAGRVHTRVDVDW